MVNKLRELRSEKDFTLRTAVKELNKKTGLSISPDTLAKYERGVREPKLVVWQKLADFYNVSILYIQGISPYKTKKEVYENQQDNNYRLNLMHFVQEQLGTDNYRNDTELQELEKALLKEQTQLNVESDRYVSYDDLLAYSNLAKILFSPNFFSHTNNEYIDKVNKLCVKLLKSQQKKNISVLDEMQYSDNIYLLQKLFKVILDAQEGDTKAIKIKSNINNEMNKKPFF